MEDYDSHDHDFDEVLMQGGELPLEREAAAEVEEVPFEIPRD